MTLGPRDSPSPPGDTDGPDPPYPGDKHVAGTRYNNDPASPPLPEPVAPGSADWVPVQGTSRPEEPAPPQPAEPAPPSPADTVPDIPMVPWKPPEPVPDPMDDPERRRTLVDAFVAEFVASATWRATLAVLEGAFPGLGMAATLSRRTDELWRIIETLDSGSPGLGVPVWLDGNGMALNLSAQLPARPRTEMSAVRPRASWPYAGAFVIDTLDPLRYHRPVGGPQAPREEGAQTPPPGEEEESGVVIVADLASAGPRVLDAPALWRHAGRVVTATLHDPIAPETRTQTRRALKALRRVVFIDPNLAVGLCLQIDVARTPRCLLAFHVDQETPRFIRP
ncbi:hypothetical protein GCM10010191_57820 [Actinomadura vinacea]|uniref:Uncharacterized protein n=1 Tax=Actinomadura vinacea TaxID=115336 RepID=A0ABP5WWA7_9ACTN